MEATNKTFNNYYKGSNTVKDQETILKVDSMIKIK